MSFMEEIESTFAAIFNPGRTEIALILRRDIPVWVLPGGGKEKEETLQEAAVREAMEETGFSVKNVRHAANLRPKPPFIRSAAVFTMEFSGIRGIPCKNEVSAVHFFSLANLPEKRMPPPFSDLICQLAREESFFEFEAHMVTWPRILKEALCHPILFGKFLFSRT
ncbi:MAG: hypothetical protein A3F09_02035 [Chlamydiae bacterium RIFCSPHIGHO2_12_FULL_49_11]|nr:MAG: hypothetical protein A3F09_02035 [Chlamydiae bacterium RIFCSPHIGHO2_12_FULL_49_11]